MQEDDKPAKVEIEGSANSWWYVCEECHGVISPTDDTCPCCRRTLDWSDIYRRKE